MLFIERHKDSYGKILFMVNGSFFLGFIFLLYSNLFCSNKKDDHWGKIRRLDRLFKSINRFFPNGNNFPNENILYLKKKTTSFC
jgi:hypothetical protein